MYKGAYRSESYTKQVESLENTVKIDASNLSTQPQVIEVPEYKPRPDFSSIEVRKRAETVTFKKGA